MDAEVCGHPTTKGPCTLLKGHKAKWHRHIARDRVWWIIRDDNGKLLGEGHSRVPLQYAMSYYLNKHDKLVVEVEVKRRS